MKKNLKTLLRTCICAGIVSAAALSTAVFAEDSAQIRILINNRFLQCEQPPVLVNDRTLVPMRAIFEALGAEVVWNEAENTASGSKDGKTVAFTIGKNEINVNGSISQIDSAPQIVNDYTMIPVRAVSEAFDCDVSWNGYHKYVIIIPKNQKPYKIEALDFEDNVLSTAYFNDKGLITELSGKETQWFAPLCTNINGNTYTASIDTYLYYNFASNKMLFEYDENNNVKQIDAFKDDELVKSVKYKYNENNMINSHNDSFYKYSENKCSIGYDFYNGNLVISEADNYKFNSKGLTGEYNYFSGGHWTKSFTYNEYGQIISEKDSGAGNATTQHTYDDAHRLIETVYQAPLIQEFATVTYRYSYE